MRNPKLNIVTLIIISTALFGPSQRAVGQADPEGNGEWETLLQGAAWPIEAIHTIVLKNGKLLSFQDGDAIILFNPMPDIGEDPVVAVAPTPLDSAGSPIRIFCSGHTQLPDGRVAFFGGGGSYWLSSHAHTVIFDPDAPPSAPWSVVDSMLPGEPISPIELQGQRWYPTSTTLSDGRVLVVGGDELVSGVAQSADIPLIFDVTKPPGQQYTQLVNSKLHVPLYPFMFQLSDGKVLDAGSAFPIIDPAEEISKTLDPVLSQWTDLVTLPISPRAGGTAVMYRPDLVLKGGGGHAVATSSAMYTLDTTSQSPEWTAITPMNHLRTHFYLIALPDGNVLAIGGEDASGVAVLEPELYDPDANTWDDLAPTDAITVERADHSTAVLLPDARVLIAGGEGNKNAQIFQPPYLFDAQGAPIGNNRPDITAVDGQTGALKAVYYGQEITITMASAPQSVAMVSLIRPGAATHNFDQSQRFMTLTINDPAPAQPAEEIRVAAPADGNVAPPGYYMLFVVDTIGGRAVPSVAQMVRLGHDCDGNGTVDYEDLASCAGSPTCADCNRNGVQDVCDLASAFSTDGNTNSVPDECDFGPPLPAPYPHDRRKNRYISFDPNKLGNDGKNVAFKVELTAITLGSCNGAAGAPPQVDFCRVGQTPGDCNRCSGGGNSCINAPIDCNPGDTCDTTGETCVNDGPNAGGSNVGRIWWVGPESPLGNGVHLLVSQPFRKVSTNWPNPNHVGDCEIVPQGVYGVRAFDVDTSAQSDELQVETTLYAPLSSSWWGDAVGPLKKFCGGDIRTPECTIDDDCTVHQTCDQAWTLPDGSVNFDDVNAVLALVQSPSMLPAPDMTWVDVHGNATGTPGSQNFDPPNFEANFSDIGQITSAFGGFPYKGHDPADCPGVDTWPIYGAPPPPSGSPVFTLVPSGDLFDPSENVQVEVYVSEATNVFAHEVALEVTGGTSGGLSLIDITVDSNRSDYLFYGVTAPLEAKDLAGQRIGSSLNAAGAGVTKTGQTYLATFTYQPVNGATGVFHIDVRGETKSFLLNPDGSTQETIPSGCAVVGYGIDCFNDSDCDDNNECTTDTCSPTNTCQYANVASGTACDDGLWCTKTGSTCDGNGNCTGGAPRCPPGYLCDEAGQQCIGAPPP